MENEMIIGVLRYFYILLLFVTIPISILNIWDDPKKSTTWWALLNLIFSWWLIYLLIVL